MHTSVFAFTVSKCYKPVIQTTPIKWNAHTQRQLFVWREKRKAISHVQYETAIKFYLAA